MTFHPTRALTDSLIKLISKVIRVWFNPKVWLMRVPLSLTIKTTKKSLTILGNRPLFRIIHHDYYIFSSFFCCNESMNDLIKHKLELFPTILGAIPYDNSHLSMSVRLKLKIASVAIVEAMIPRQSFWYLRLQTLNLSKPESNIEALAFGTIYPREYA